MIDALGRICARLARIYTLHSPIAVGKRAIIAGTRPFGLLQRSREAFTVTSLVGPRFRVRFPDMIQNAIFFCGVWEPAISAFMSQRLRPGDTFVDVGANIGYHTCLGAQRVGENGCVWAFEPSPSIADLLEENVRLNGFRNVRLFRMAVSDEETRVRVLRGSERSLGTTRVAKKADVAGDAITEVEVEARPLGAIVPRDRLHRARLIKIDVEGAEGLVIAGLAGELHLFQADTEWIVELTPGELLRQGTTASEIVRRFARVGYRSFAIDNRYDIDWYVRSARGHLRAGVRTLLRAVPDDLDQQTQIDLVFTRDPEIQAGPTR